MTTDTEIRVKGIQVLTKNLGEVEAERFISLLLREPFDYTQWQNNLFEDKSVRALSAEAMKLRKAK
ncbi:MAG: hypothetical protein AAF984_00900 [Verrucomicrobiota bacterium]